MHPRITRYQHAFNSFARDSSIVMPSFGCWTVNATTSFYWHNIECQRSPARLDLLTLKIPPFCHAISVKVLPRTLTWSIPNAVIPVTTGLGTILVLSYVPPTPTSSTVASTLSCMKTWKAINVTNLKYPGIGGVVGTSI